MPITKMIDVKTATDWGLFCKDFGWIAVSVVEFVVAGILFSSLIYLLTLLRKERKDFEKQIDKQAENFHNKFAEQEEKHEKEVLERDAWWKEERVRIGSKFDELQNKNFQQGKDDNVLKYKFIEAIKTLNQSFLNAGIKVEKTEIVGSDLTKIIDNGEE
jgi:hypothetical protein